MVFISEAEIDYHLEAHGYYFHRGVGKLKPHSLGRRGCILWGFINVFIILILYGASNLRVASWQAEALAAHYELEGTKAALTDQQAANHVNAEQLQKCMVTLTRYETTLSHAESSVREQASTNPQAAQLLRVILFLKTLL